MTAAEFITAFPAFATTDKTRIQAQINEIVAEGLVSSDRAEGKYAYVLGLAVAHRVTVELADRAAGPSLAVDAVSFAAKGGAVTRSSAAVERGVIDDWSRTHYGRRYLQQMRVIGMGAIAV